MPPLTPPRGSFAGALAAGLVLGTTAALGLGLVELAGSGASAAASFDGAGETLRFFAVVLLLLAAAGALVGLVEGALWALVTRLERGDGEAGARGRARIYTALALPAVALGCAQIFRGPRARTIPGHDLYAVAIGMVALALGYLGIRLWQRLLADEHATRRGQRRLGLVALAAVLVAALLYRVDQRVLPRLYPFFHHGLGLGSFAAMQLAAVALYLRSAARQGRAARLGEPRFALLLGLLVLASGVLARSALERQRALRTVALERTVLVAPLVRLVHRHAAAPTSSASPDPAAAGPILDGPHLGAVDVFLITIDAWRADRLSPRTAPELDALANRGVRFDRAYTQVPHTSFSVATLLTGKYVYALSALGLDAASHQTLAEVMKRERYKTAAFYPPSVFYIDHERLRALEDSAYGFEYVKYEHLDARGRTQQIIDFLERERPARAFVWAHYIEPHEPYEAHPGHLDGAASAIERYDGEVHYADAEVARLVAYLQKTRPRALVVIASDHGEEFGEHGGRYHGTALYEEQVRVPLAFVPLDGALTSHRVDTAVGLVDVAPTLLGLIGVPPSARMRGRDLGPWLLPPGQASSASRGPLFAEIERKKMAVEGHHKLICDLENDACAAYDLDADPGERRDRSDAPFAAQLRAALDRWMAEETRFEGRGGGDARAERVLERARLGDKTVAGALAELARAPEPSVRLEAARLLSALPADTATREALAAAPAEAALAPWLDLDLARVGDAAARTRLEAAAATRCAGDAKAGDAKAGDAKAGDAKAGDDEWCGRAALALGDVPGLGRALEQPGEHGLGRELVAALGRSRDPRALEPLLIALGQVRIRGDVVAALAVLDDARALPYLIRWLPLEPYVPVRAAMTSLVAQLGRRDGSGAARAALEGLAQSEGEAPVMAALLPALASLGAGGVTDLGHASARPGGELWLAGGGDGSVEVEVAGSKSRVAFSGAARVATPRGGRVRVRVLDGDAAPRLGLSRRLP